MATLYQSGWLFLCVGVLGCLGVGCKVTHQPVDDGIVDASADTSPQRDAGEASVADVDVDVSTEGGDADEYYALEIENGFGAGSYRAGTKVHVFGSFVPAAARNLGFETLTGEPLLAHSNEWHTTLIMPDGDVRLRHRSQISSSLVSILEFPSVSGRALTLRYHRVDEPIGLIFFLHGTGGSSAIFETVEARAFWMSAVARGYTVVAPEAEESVAGDLDGDGNIRWNVQPSNNNKDFQNIERLVVQARNQEWAGPNTPIFVVGMSNGGSMSVTLGAIAASASPFRDEFPSLQFGAVVSFCATGNAQSVALTETPSAWYMAARDTNPQVGVEAIAEAQGFSDGLLSRSVDSDFALHEPSPLYPERFARSPEIDEATSRLLVAELDAAGVLDDQGLLNARVVDIESTISSMPSNFPQFTSLSATQKLQIKKQLKVVDADHQFFSDFTERALDFLDRNR